MIGARAIAASMALWCLTACHSKIQQGLEERQANELQRVLIERNISAQKVSEGARHPSWAIEVPREQASDAIRILAELGLPRTPPNGFNELFDKGSWVSSPMEERARYLQALSGELARTLETVEGVLTARVHLVLPPPSRAGFSTASIAPGKGAAFLKVHPGMKERILEQSTDLRALVAGSVEGVGAESVVLVVEEAASQVLTASAPPAALPRAKRAILILSMLVVLLSILLMSVGWKLHRRLAFDGAPAHG